jgi:hypothetical protein
MEIVLQVIKVVVSSLQSEGIPACIIGEIALNYYDVPRVVHVSVHRHLYGLS